MTKTINNITMNPFKKLLLKTALWIVAIAIHMLVWNFTAYKIDPNYNGSLRDLFVVNIVGVVVELAIACVMLVCYAGIKPFITAYKKSYPKKSKK